ncbi:sialidase family protein [Echinicola shivajiensis]|uniref:sialidase family protein n=1 Tax=Echinicola shivajiensis TaxID=1035916 RepID=UPI00293D5A97|nr:exo-alpha-sialidase [Echinicola shivajiensis]
MFKRFSLIELRLFIVVIILIFSLMDFAIAQELALNKIQLKEQLIFPLQSQHVHGSSIVSLPNGDMLAVWFQGSGERKSDDVRIMGARLEKGKNKWSIPFLMADTPGLPDCNPVLFLNNNNKLFLVWIAVQANQWEESILRFRTSLDYSEPGAPKWEWQDNILLKPGDEFAEEVREKTKDLPKDHSGWSEYARPYDEHIASASEDKGKRSTGWMTRIKPLLMENGKIILPLYSDGFNFSLMAISEDDGDTWRPSLPLVGRGPIQPALAQKENGDLVALMRDSGGAPSRVQKSISSDGGKSWTASLKTDMPNTASVELLKWDKEHWLFLGNDISDGRYQLSLFMSGDEGDTWSRICFLENDENKKDRYSYPCMIKGRDGKLHITYSSHLSGGEKSIKYQILDPEVLLK